MARDDKEGKILDELREIYRTINDAYFKDNFPKFRSAKQAKQMFEDLGMRLKQTVASSSDEIPQEGRDMLAQMERELKGMDAKIMSEVHLPKRALEIAIDDIRALGDRAKDCGDYVKTALKTYEGVVQAFASVDADVIFQNIDLFDPLYALLGSCILESPSYMRNPAPNRCRKAVYLATDIVSKLEENSTLAGSMGNDKHSKQLTEAKKAIETHLNLCKACPFMEYGRQRQEQ